MADPVAIVTALREPAYIQRYLRVLQKHAKELTSLAGPILDAVALVNSKPWIPAEITSDVNPETAWFDLERPIVDLIAAFANAEADFGEHRDLMWRITAQLVRAVPTDLPPLDEPTDREAHNDAYGRAINTTYGKALEAAVSVGWLDHRRDGTTPQEFVDLLDFAITVPGAVGAELRSILAVSRPVLEYSAADWLDRCHEELFGGELGQVTFEATLKYPRPTTWLYENYRTRIAAAALDKVPSAVALPLIGYLWDLEKFTIASVLGGYHSNVDVLRETAEEIASLVSDAEADEPMLNHALKFWDGMLDGAGSTVPKAALAGAGRWVYVDKVNDEELLPRLERTVLHTGGVIDFETEVADRCRDAQPNATALRILRLIQGHGDPWERDHVGDIAIEALVAAAGHDTGPEFNELRDRLLELGYHAAADIEPGHI